MTVMSALVWYIIPGLIGRAYDLRNNTVGPDIFNHDVEQKARVVNHYLTTSEYKLITDMTDATDFLDVKGELSLKIKTGNVNIAGVGSYLKQTGSFKNKVDLLVKTHYETVSVTIPTNEKPIDDWQKTIEGTGNTHYIRSIVYGGDLIASLSFVASNEADLEHIKGEIQGEMSSSSGSFGGGLKGSLEKILNKTKESASMTINYYATVPIDNVPRTIEGLFELIEKFPSQARKVNNGRGVPLQMEVFSLESLSQDRNTYYNTMAYVNLLDVIDEQFSDIRTARTRLSDWMQSIPPVLSDEMNKKISDFSTKLQDLAKVYSEVINNLDMSNESSPAQFEPAFKAYKGDQTYIYPNMYVNRLSNLKVEVLSSTPALEADFGGAVYTYWGKSVCPPESIQTTTGKMYNAMLPGSTRYLCLDNTRDYIPANKNENADEDITDLPELVPAKFVSQGNDMKDNYEVECAFCRLPGKTSVTMLPGMKSCPSGWTKQYEGILVAGETETQQAELICLDSQDLKKTDSTEKLIITEASVSCDNFPCSSAGASETKALACVVCSIQKETKSKADIFYF